MMNGTEMLLKSIGLGDVIDMAKKLATDGTSEKIVRFVSEIDAINSKMDRIIFLLEGDKSNGRYLAPGSSAGNGDGDAARIIDGTFTRPEPVGQSEPSGDADGGCAIAM